MEDELPPTCRTLEVAYGTAEGDDCSEAILQRDRIAGVLGCRKSCNIYSDVMS